MESFMIYSIQNCDSENDRVGSGLPFYARTDHEAIEIVKTACKGVDPEMAEGHYLVQIGEFFPFSLDQIIIGCLPRAVAACGTLCAVVHDKEVSDEGSEV